MHVTAGKITFAVLFKMQGYILSTVYHGCHSHILINAHHNKWFCYAIDYVGCANSVFLELHSSVVPPKTIDEYRRDRELSLKSLLVVCMNPVTGYVHNAFYYKVPTIKPFQVHSKVLKDQCDICLKSEYTPSNLAILLHQV